MTASLFTEWQTRNPLRTYSDWVAENAARMAASRPPCGLPCPSQYIPTHKITTDKDALYTCTPHLIDGLKSVIYLRHKVVMIERLS